MKDENSATWLDYLIAFALCAIGIAVVLGCGEQRHDDYGDEDELWRTNDDEDE